MEYPSTKWQELVLSASLANCDSLSLTDNEKILVPFVLFVTNQQTLQSICRLSSPIIFLFVSPKHTVCKYYIKTLCASCRTTFIYSKR